MCFSQKTRVRELRLTSSGLRLFQPSVGLMVEAKYKAPGYYTDTVLVLNLRKSKEQ